MNMTIRFVPQEDVSMVWINIHLPEHSVGCGYLSITTHYFFERSASNITHQNRKATNISRHENIKQMLTEGLYKHFLFKHDTLINVFCAEC